MSETITTEATTIETPAPATDQPPLGIQDLTNALQIIDFAAEQGAFKGWATITQVMQVRNRIETFLKSVPTQETAEAETPADANDLPPESPAA